MPELQAIPRPPMPAAKWALRLELAAMYRIFGYLGWTKLICSHITARVPGTDDQCLINSFEFNPQYGAGRDVFDAL